MNIFEEVRKLGFSDGHYIVVGSGIMAAKGIRATNDLDIVVSEELFEQCKRSDWEVFPWTKESIPGKEWLRKGKVELYSRLSRKAGDLSVEELLTEAEVIEGIPFLTLERLIEFKTEYGRPKDFQDIDTIKRFLAK